MKPFPLTLDDLKPVKAQFELSGMPGKKFTVCAFSLRVRIHVQEKYSVGQFQEVLQKRQIKEIAELVYFMLEDKSLFKDEDAFFDAILSPKDELEIQKALVHSMGVSEPRLEELIEEDRLQKEREALNPKAISPTPTP